MRHALVPVHLIHSARSAAAGSARYGAESETDESYGRPARRSRRSAGSPPGSAAPAPRPGPRFTHPVRCRVPGGGA